MKFFIDTANVEEIRKANDMGVICGVTTNPSLIAKEHKDYAKTLAEIASIVGLDGVVCSPLEAGVVHERCGKDFLTVTPGVRFADGDVGDQKRVTTPAKAKELGSDYIVVGRPITQAEDPVAAYRRCREEFVD